MDKKTRIAITDTNGNLHVIHEEFPNVSSAVEWLKDQDDYLYVGNNKYVNPSHIVSVKVNYDVE